MTIVYRIRRKSDGLFSTGGTWPKFSENGKIWKARNHVSSHLKQVGGYGKSKEQFYSDCEVVSYVIEESELDSLPALEWEVSDKTKRTKQLAEERRVQRELEELARRRQRLEAELAAINEKIS